MHKLETLYKEGKVKHSAERDDIDLSKIDASKPIVVLDMDETMLSATQDNSPQFETRVPPEYMEADVDLELVYGSETAQTIRVTYRPYLLQTLHFLAEKMNLVVYTAGTQPYAEPILDDIDPKNELFALRLYRHHCI